MTERVTTGELSGYPRVVPARTTPDLALTGLIALAAFRTTRLVTADSLTAPLRERAFNRWPPSYERSRQRWNGERLVYRADDAELPAVSPLGRLLDCHWCVSVYAAAAWTAATPVPLPVLTFAAAAAAAGFLGAADRALA